MERNPENPSAFDLPAWQQDHELRYAHENDHEPFGLYRQKSSSACELAGFVRHAKKVVLFIVMTRRMWMGRTVFSRHATQEEFLRCTDPNRF